MAVTIKEAEGKPQMVVIETPNNPIRMEDLLRTRKTYRLFLDKPIGEREKRELMKIFDSPSGIETGYGNLHRFWGYKLVEDRETRKRIFEEAVYSRAASAVKTKAFDEMLNAPLHIVVYIKINKIEEEYKDDTTRKSVFWQAVHDSSALSGIAANLAHEFGLSEWWIGHQNAKKLSEVLDLPEGLLPTHTLVFGYPRTDEKEGRILREAGKSFPRGAPKEMVYFEERFGNVFSRVGKLDIEKRMLIRFDEIPMFKNGVEKQIEMISEKTTESESIEIRKIKDSIFKLIDEDKPGLNEKVNTLLRDLFIIVKEVRERSASAQ